MALPDYIGNVYQYNYMVNAFKFLYREDHSNTPSTRTSVVEESNYESNIAIDIPSERVYSIGIEERYETLFFPLFYIELILEDSTYFEIQSRKNDILGYIRLDKVRKNQNGTPAGINTKAFEGVFQIVLDDEGKDTQMLAKQRVNNGDMKQIVKDDKGDLHKTGILYKIYLFPESMSGVHHNVNRILHNVNMVDVVNYIMNVGGITNVLMAPPDNKKVYDEFILPPLSVLRSLQFIDTYYGLYNTGTMAFFGLKYNYILPYDGKFHVAPKGASYSQVVIVVSSTDSTSGIGSTITSNGVTAYMVTDANGYESVNASITNDYLHANDIKSIDSFGENVITAESGATSKNTTNYSAYFKNWTENPLLPFAYAAQTHALSRVLNIRITNIDIDMLEPWRSYYVFMEDPNHTKEYSGLYMLTDFGLNFISDGGEFRLSGTITLKSATFTPDIPREYKYK